MRKPGEIWLIYKDVENNITPEGFATLLEKIPDHTLPEGYEKWSVEFHDYPDKSFERVIKVK